MNYSSIDQKQKIVYYDFKSDILSYFLLSMSQKELGLKKMTKGFLK